LISFFLIDDRLLGLMITYLVISYTNICLKKGILYRIVVYVNKKLT
jgi:hypothetical protein